MDSVIRVLVVDDSMVYRTVVRESLAAIPGVEIVGSANNGRIAIEKIELLTPDLVTLDFEMPEVDGLGVLRWMRQHRSTSKAIMLSALTHEGAAATMKALQEGALDFVVKPSGIDARQNVQELVDALKQRVQTIRFLKEKHSRSLKPPLQPLKPASILAPTPATSAQRSADRPARPMSHPVSVVGIGVSTGGPDALRVMLPMLPADLRVPVLLVQHMPPVFTKSLAESLDKLCRLRVCEAQDGQIVKAGEVLIAPGGHQMKVVKEADVVKIRLTDDAPIQSCKPSVDYLLESLKDVYGARCLSVIMTGMGYDGADSSKALHQLGGPVIAQNEATCIVYGMPRRPVTEGYANVVSPLDQIAGHIVRYVKG